MYLYLQVETDRFATPPQGLNLGGQDEGAAMADRRRLITAAPACFAAGALYGWSALAAPLRSGFGVSVTQVGLVFSLALGAFTGAVLIAPRLSAEYGQTRVLAGCTLAAAICVAGAGVAPSFEVFLALFGIGFGLTSGAIYSTALGLTASAANPRLATPLMVAGFGLGGVVFGPAFAILVAEGWGLRALWPLSGALLLAWWIAWRGERETAPAAQPDSRDRQPAPPLDRRRLALIWGIFALGAFPGLAVIGLAASVMDAAGGTITLIGFVLAGVAAGNTLGRLSGALPWSAVDAPPAMALYAASLLSALGLAAPLLGLGVGLIGVGLILIALGYGLMAAAIPLATARVFGALRFQTAFGLIFTAWGVAGLSAPWVVGWLFDVTGSFWAGFALALAGSLGTLPLIAMLTRQVE